MKTIINYIPFLIILVSSCGSANETIEEEVPETELIQLTSQQLAYNDIQTGRLTRQPLTHAIKATGRLDVPPNLSITLTAPVSSYISKILVLPGDEIKKGGVIATLRDPAIAKVQEDYLSTKARLGFLKNSLERKGQLVESKAVSAKEYEDLKSQETSVRTHLNGLIQELDRLDIRVEDLEAGSITQSLQVKAPISGTVTEIYSKVGTFITNESPLISILNRDHEHVELEIFQQDLLKVKKNMAVRLSLPGSDEVFEGYVFLVNAQLNSESLSSNVHVHPEAGFPKIPVGSVVFGEVIYQTDSVFTLPKSEVILEGQTAFIFTSTDSGFKKEEIKTGYDNGEYVEIVGPSAIFEKDIVTRGNYYLNGI